MDRETLDEKEILIVTGLTQKTISDNEKN